MARRPAWLAPEHVVDVFVFVTVLNLFAQFAPDVITEGFAMSLLVALLMKFAIEGVVAVKKRAIARIGGAPTRIGRAIGLVTLLLLMPGSKLIILWLVDVVFGDKVSLGGFWLVTALIVTLTLSRELVRRFLVTQP